MMSQSKTFAPPYSQVMIVGPGSRVVVPEWAELVPAIATDTCIAVLCRTEIDGPTTITLGLTAELDPGRPPVFTGRLKTPKKRLVLETAEGDKVMEAPTLGEETLVKVWSNQRMEPDHILIGYE